MIKDITIGQYLPGESYVHRADPRVKIVLTFAYMILAIIISSYIGLILFALFTTLIIVLAEIPFRYIFKGLKPVIIIVLFTAVINLFAIKGTPIFEFGFIHITYEGISMTVKMMLRLTLLIVSASILTLTTTPILLTDGMEKLMGPLRKIKVPVHEIAMMMTIALRFIPTLLEETDKIMKAQAARGADFDTGNIIQRAKSFVPVLVPLFVSAFRRADDLAVAMEARCYRGSMGRTKMKQLKIGALDIKIIIASGIFLIGIIFLEYFL